jgi:hypothetical protein
LWLHEHEPRALPWRLFDCGDGHGPNGFWQQIGNEDDGDERQKVDDYRYEDTFADG